MIEPAPHRPRCYRCMRPQRLCLCGGLPSVITQTAMVILQHPHERKHPFGTARLVALCLPEARVHVAYGGLAGDLHCPLDLPKGTALLYPHADAMDLAEVAADDPPSTLLVLDGTWSHARKLYVQNPWLAGLRHVRFHPRAPSRYRIRREPQPDYVSTLEAIVEALQILEPDTAGLHELGAAFDRMIDRQIGLIGSAKNHGRRKHERLRPSRCLPPLLDEKDLVIAYAESSVPGGDVTAQRELVQWVAARVESGETFECVIRPAAAGPSPYHLAHMGIAPETLADGVSLAQARESFAQWAGRSPVAAWTKTSLEWGRSVMAPGTPECVLKTAYSNLRNHGAGVIEEVIRREGLQQAPIDCRGRARDRLGNAPAVARWLRSMRGARRAAEAAAGTPSCSS